MAPARPPGRRAAARLAALGAALLALVSCAPRPVAVAPLDAGGRLARYRARLVEREARPARVEATLWARGPAACDTCAPARLPAVQADLVVRAPASLRLRVRSAFGTAVDVALRGDSLFAYAPGAGLAACLDAVRDSFGPPAPGALAAGAVAAAWRVPATAAGRWRDGALELAWRDGDDSAAVAVDAAGLPLEARRWRDGAAAVRVRYARWETVDGVTWPTAWSLEAGGGAGLDCRVARVTFADGLDPSRLAVRVPDGAERIGAGELRRLLGALGGAR